MLDQIQVQYDVLIEQALGQIASKCVILENGSGHMAHAAMECQAMAKELKGAILHVNLSGAELVCAAADALRANKRFDLVEKLEVIIQLIKNGHARKIVGHSFMQANVQNLLDAAGKAGAAIVGLEDPRSNEVIPLGQMRKL